MQLITRGGRRSTGAYANGQKLVAQLQVPDAGHVAAVQRLLQRTEVDYIEVRDKEAGCYDFRIERVREVGAQPSATNEFKC